MWIHVKPCWGEARPLGFLSFRGVVSCFPEQNDLFPDTFVFLLTGIIIQCVKSVILEVLIII